MVKHKESLISAHHNYLVNEMLAAGFALGDPNSEYDFWLLAEIVPPGETSARLSGRLFDRQGEFILEIRKGEIVQNPGRCVLQNFSGGLRVLHPSGDVLLSLSTQPFTNGYMTRIQGKFYDKSGRLRAEPSHDGIKIYGEVELLPRAGAIAQSGS